MIATALLEKRELEIDQSKFYRDISFKFEDTIYRSRSQDNKLFSYSNELRIKTIASLNGELSYNQKIGLNQDFKEIIRNTIIKKSGFQKALYKSKFFNESRFTNHDFKRYADILRVKIVNNLDLNDVEKNRIDCDLRQTTADAIKYRNKYINSLEDSPEKRILYQLYQIENFSQERILEPKIKYKKVDIKKSDDYYFKIEFPRLLKNLSEKVEKDKSLESLVEEKPEFFTGIKEFFKEISNKLYIIYSSTRNSSKKVKSNVHRKISSHIPYSLKILNSRWKLKREDLVFSFNNFAREFSERTLNKLNRGFSYASLLTFLITSLTTVNKPVETIIVDPNNYYETFYSPILKQITDPDLSNEEKQLIIEKFEDSKNLTKETPINITAVEDISTKTKYTAEEQVRTYLKSLPTHHLLDRPEDADRIFSILINSSLSDSDLKSEAGLILVESGGNPNAVSPDGAAGLAQLMPRTAREDLDLRVPRYPIRIRGRLYTLENPIRDSRIDERFNPVKNIEASIEYRLKLKNRFKGDLGLELASYNAGPTPVEDCMCIPNNGETPDFVGLIKSNIQEINNIHNQIEKEKNLETYLEGIKEGTIKPPVFDYLSLNYPFVRLILSSALGEEWFNRHYGSLDANTLEIIYKFIERNKDNKVKTLIDRDSKSFEESLNEAGRIVFLYDSINLEHIEGLSLGLNDKVKPLILVPKYEMYGITGEAKTLEEIEERYYVLSTLVFSNTGRKNLGNQNKTDLVLN